MSIQLITPPAEEPVSLAEAKLHCRIEADATDEDALIAGLIVAARQAAEHETGRALVRQVWRMSLDAFPVAAIEAPHPPLISVDEIRYIDPDGALQTLDETAYRLHRSSISGLILPAYGTRWPATRLDVGAVEIDLTVGYGDAADVPQAIKHWMLLSIGTWYACRETVTSGQLSSLPRNAWDALLDPYRAWRAA